MKALPLLLILACACLALTGCPAYSLRPLYTEQDAVMEPALEGDWATPRPEDTEVSTFRRSEGHAYALSVFHPDTKVQENYTVQLVRLEGQTYMDLMAEDQRIGGTKLDGLIGLIPTHVILKVKISGDDLAFATWEDDAIRKQGPGTAGLDHQMVEGGVLVTAPTEVLRRYITAHAEDAFTPVQYLKRKGKTPVRP